MRRALHIKDDDYRLSFLHGNFITLTNMKQEDYLRIFEQRLSPLYISVHATDDDVRRRHLQSPHAKPIMADLRMLIDHGIDIHTQNVIVPGDNDGAILDQTLADLSGLYPGSLSIGVVPVGLTKHREKRPEVQPATPAQAGEIIAQVDRARAANLIEHDDPLVYAADELYILAGQPVPEADYYLDFPQLENGIGLLRHLVDTFDEQFESLPESISRAKEIVLVTGRSAEPTLTELTGRINSRVAKLTTTVLPVDNEFWGRTVTVSGLLTGEDIVAALRSANLSGREVLLPPDCLNRDGLFLDDETIDSVAATTGCRLHPSSYNLIESVENVLAA